MITENKIVSLAGHMSWRLHGKTVAF